MGKLSDFGMPECLDPVAIYRQLSLAVGGLRMLKSLPGMLVPGFVFLLSVLLSRTVRMGG